MTSHHPPSPPALVEAILRQHRKFILDMARWVGVPRFDVQDVFQRVALALTGAPHTIPRRGDLRPWLRVVTQREACNYFAQYPRRMLRLPLSAAPRLAPPATLEEAIILRQTRNVVRAAIRRLPRPRRLVWLLHEHRGLTFKAIAARLGLPVSTVQCRHQRALRDLTALLLRRAKKEERGPGGRGFAFLPLLWWRDLTERLRRGAVRPSMAAACLLCALLPWHTLPRAPATLAVLSGPVALSNETALSPGVHEQASPTEEALSPVAATPSKLVNPKGTAPKAKARAPEAASPAGPLTPSEPDRRFHDIMPARTWMARAQQAVAEGDLDLARSALRGYDDCAPDNPWPEARRAVARALEGGRR